MRVPESWETLFRGKVPPDQVGAVFRQLSDLLRAGIPLARALNLAAEQAGHPALRRALEAVARGVREGRNLSRTLADHPDLFRDGQISLVRAGEAGGSLERALARQADLSEQEEEIRSQVRAALAYPLFIVLVGLGTVLFVVAVIVPRLAVLLSDFQDRLSASTRLLLALSRGLRSDPWLWSAVVSALGIFLSRPRIRERLARARDGLLFRAPAVRDWLIRRETAAWARTLGTLLENGVPVVPALETAEGTVRNRAFRERLGPLGGRIRQGWSLSRCLREHPLFAPQVSSLVAVGEEGGRLAEALLRIAETQERRSQRELRTAVSLLEPALILLIGAFLGWVVLSILLPILEINTMIR